MSQKSDPQAVSVFTEGVFAKGEEKRQVLCSEIWARTSTAEAAALGEEVGSADVPLVACDLGCPG